jgi:hypothetical protein
MEKRKAQRPTYIYEPHPPHINDLGALVMATDNELVTHKWRTD